LSVEGNKVYLQEYMQGKMTKQRKKRALSLDYVSTKQLTFEGFETTFAKSLNPNNRWVVLAKLAGVGAICLLSKYFESFSARYLENSILLQPARVSDKTIFDTFDNTKPVAA